MHKYKILNLATVDIEGAGTAAVVINERLNKLGYNSKLLVYSQYYKRKDVIGIQPYFKGKIYRIYYRILNKVYREIKKKKIGYTDKKYNFLNIENARISSKQLLRKIGFVPEIILLHWITDFINAKVIAELKEITNAKIIWSMTDNSPLTGGCHYPWDCNGYALNCGDCPAFKYNKKKYIAKKSLLFKEKYLPKDITIIGTSNDCNRAQNSTLYKGKMILPLVFAFDKEKYCPGNIEAAQNFFGIKKNRKVIFCGATNFSDERKGTSYLLEALSILNKKYITKQLFIQNITLLIAGSEVPKSFFSFNFDINFVGKLSEKELIEAYRAADLFVCPSLEDSGPAMINQSIACATPVVSFETGVALDIVIPGESGYLAKLGNSADLAHGIDTIINMSKKDLSNMRNNCLNIMEEFNFETSIKKIFEITYKNSELCLMQD